MPPHKVVILEDDGEQGRELTDFLERAFLNVEVDWLTTERSFLDHLDQWEESPPDVFILDVMVRWANPRRGDWLDEALEEADRDSAAAGLRCADAIRGCPRLTGIPLILYTVLEHGDLEQSAREALAEIERRLGARYVPKIESFDPLAAAIDELLARRAQAP